MQREGIIIFADICRRYVEVTLATGLLPGVRPSPVAYQQQEKSGYEASENLRLDVI